jgi:hypothetical protein
VSLIWRVVAVLSLLTERFVLFSVIYSEHLLRQVGASMLTSG